TLATAKAGGVQCKLEAATDPPNGGIRIHPSAHPVRGGGTQSARKQAKDDRRSHSDTSSTSGSREEARLPNLISGRSNALARTINPAESQPRVVISKLLANWNAVMGASNPRRPVKKVCTDM